MFYAEPGDALLCAQLAGQQQPLVARQLARKAGDAIELLAQQCDPLDVGALVDQPVASPIARRDRQRSRDRCLDRAAPAERALAVGDARTEPLLERVGDVLDARKLLGATGAKQQLNGRLAVAVLELLAPEPVPVLGEQQLAPLTDHERRRLQRVEQAQAAQPAIAPPSPPAPSGRHRPGGLKVRLRSGALDGCRRAGGSKVRLRGGASGGHASMSVRVVDRPPSQSPGLGARARRALRRFDAYQQRSRRLAFAVAVIKRYGEDEAGSLGALIAYYGFFSLFPLLLVFVTVLDFALQGDLKAQADVLHSTLSQFPVIGSQIRSNIGSIKGSALALTVGIVGSLLAGLAVTGATQKAFNKVWQIPRARRFGFFGWRLRGLALLAVLGVLSIVSTVAAGYATGQTRGAPAVLLGVAIALAANLLLFFTVFRLMTSEQIATRELVPGIVLAAVLWQTLQHVGGLYVEHVIRHAQETAGVFALVLGLLSWLYLGGQVVLLAAEVNVVRARHLWPRRLFEDS